MGRGSANQCNAEWGSKQRDRDSWSSCWKILTESTVLGALWGLSDHRVNMPSGSLWQDQFRALRASAFCAAVCGIRTARLLT
jgi:hypothetical protein